MAQPSSLSTPRSALAIGAHPDDIEFGCGATLAKWAAAGCEVHHLVCTDGSKGSWDQSENLAELVSRRQVEQRSAAAALGARGEVIFLGWPDGELESGLRQRVQISSWIRRLKPEVLLGHDPWKRYRLHPDHRNAGWLVCDGLVAARDPHFFPETGLAAHRPSAIPLWEADEADHAEDVSDFVDIKIKALLEHESQLLTTMDISASDTEQRQRETGAFKEKIRDRCAETGGRWGFVAAEEFKLIERT